MMLRRKRIETLFLMGLIITMFVGCDNDFIDLDSDLINSDIATNFNIDSVQYDVIAYTVPLGPVQTDGLPMYFLGAFEDPNYGLSTQNFVSQLNFAPLDPDFGQEATVDSVILYIPYFSTSLGLNDDNILEYQLDSIYGDGPIKLSIYESNYFLRDFDPGGEFDESQRYFSNMSTSPTEPINEDILTGTTILEQQELAIDDSTIFLTDEAGDTIQSLAPGIRIKLDNDFWQEKIIDMGGSTELSTINNFNEYFRGVYFKSEKTDFGSSLIGLNLSNFNASITIHYSRDPLTDPEDEDEDEDESDEQEQATFELRFGNTITNFTENDFNVTIPAGDDQNGDSRLFLKGNEGSRATIRLFDGQDEEGNSNFENFQKEFGNYEDGEFVSYKKLVNEANLILYVDQEAVMGEEPERIYVYDLDNNGPLTDYILGGVVQNNPSFSLVTHLGFLERENDDPDGDGIRYKMRLTNHIISLIESDSTNVELGLAVASNVNIEATNTQRSVQTTDGSEQFIPLSAILSPRGTILHGNKSEDEEKRLFLEIFFSCLKTDEDCGDGN